MATLPLLPTVSTHDSFDAYAANADAGLDAARAVAERHGFPSGNVERFPTGAMLVFRVGHTRVVKLYPSLYQRKYAAEKAALQLVADRLPIATPIIIADGELDGWFYLGMTLLPGAPIDIVFDEIDPLARAALLRRLGAAVALLHAIEIPNGSPLLHPWDDYVTDQVNGAVHRQRRLGLDERYVTQIPNFLSRFERDLRDANARTLLHTELGPSHVLVVREMETWGVGGLFDFGDAFAGPPEFEFPAVALFVAKGDRALFREFLRSYGARLDSIGTTGPFHQRMLAYALIHKYSNIHWYLKETPVDVQDASLESLAAAWFEVT